MRFPTIVIFLSIALHGCATMSVDECASADWRAFGYEDGTNGETMGKGDKRSSACAKHGYAMNRDAYINGRNEGLSNYCTEDSGYTVGASGLPYNGVCINHNETRFLEAHSRGHQAFGFSAAAATTAGELRSAKSKHAKLDSQLQKYDGGYRDEGLSMEEHNNKVLNIWAERKYLKTIAIPHWTSENGRAKHALENYRAMVAIGNPRVNSLKPIVPVKPRPYTGPTKNDAREMVAEVFSRLGK